MLGQVTEKFRNGVKVQAERQQIPVYQFQHKERKDDIANDFRLKMNVRGQIVFIGVAQEKAKAFNGTKVNCRFQFNRNKTVYVYKGRSKADHRVFFPKTFQFNLQDALALNGGIRTDGIPAGAELVHQLVLDNQVMLGSVNAARGHFPIGANDLEQAHLRWGAHVDGFDHATLC